MGHPTSDTDPGSFIPDNLTGPRVEYFQEKPPKATRAVESDPWRWRVRFANGEISGHDYNSRRGAIEGFQDHAVAVLRILANDPRLSPGSQLAARILAERLVEVP